MQSIHELQQPINFFIFEKKFYIDPFHIDNCNPLTVSSNNEFLIHLQHFLIENFVNAGKYFTIFDPHKFREYIICDKTTANPFLNGSQSGRHLQGNSFLSNKAFEYR